MRLHNHGIELLEASAVPAIVVQDEGIRRKLDGDGIESKTGGALVPSILEDVDSDVKARQDGNEGRQSKSKIGLSFRSSGSWSRLILNAIVQHTISWYKVYIFHGLLRQREILPSKDGRHIDLDASRYAPLIDERTGKLYISNSIRSSRYTIWTFFPYQIWFQFTKAANLYFLIIGICQLIPGLSTTGSFTTVVPLLLFLTFSISREGYDDFRRYRLDAVENRRLARVLYGHKASNLGPRTQRSLINIAAGRWSIFKSKAISLVPNRFKGSSPSINIDTSPSSPWETVKWIVLQVGDIIELKRDDQVPADIVLLHADGQNGIAYTETMALDGETNLKSKEPSHMLAKTCTSLKSIVDCRAQFVIEDPNLDLYDFSGKVTVDGTTLPLTLNNVIFRGSTLRNTKSAIGMVINTGEECKIRMNASKNPKAKAPALQTETNKAVVSLAALVVLLAVGCTAGYVIWQRVLENKAWYLNDAQIWLVDIFIAFAIEFNNLIPLALYVSLEIVKFSQYLLLHDIEMYDPVSDIPMISNTQTIFENLGQVNYIFSDKTGTLTENSMRFRKMSVAGTTWLYQGEQSDEITKQIHEPEVRTRVEKDVSTAMPSPGVEGFLRIPQRPRTAVSQVDSARPISSHEHHTDELLRYLQSNGGTVFAEKVKLFLLSMAICHTCLPEVDESGSTRYQAASPDEVALVEAARDLGYMVVERTTKSITILISLPGSGTSVRETYEVLDVIEFSSGRKRMSVIVRFPDGKICIICKGADSVIQPRLRNASLAAQEASKVAHQDRQRMSLEVEQVLMRKSGEQDSRGSFQRSSFHRPSFQRASISFDRRGRPSFQRASRSFDRRGMSKTGTEVSRTSMSVSRLTSTDLRRDSPVQRTIDVAGQLDDSGVFERCFQDINDFASEGLRTLLYGHRFVDEEEYLRWKEVHHQAETSLVRRQEMIESAAELIEVAFHLAGATAIEDKLQNGVSETIEKLQKADIKIWMLTGDKRETAINVAHAARICKTYSEVVVLNQEDCEAQVASMLFEISEGRIAHSVVVIDGKILGEIEGKETLATIFSDLLIRVDSVIVCRASPSQKADMVKKIRHRIPSSMTLAIGDGGNDIAMIQEAHVGVGISGKEGLQAARVADYSIAQFRFLQRLLLVHGHWNYSRTADYVLYTFWKEMMFYCVQVMYQRWNGYTGPSFYETDGLTVWNTLFSSLCVMLPAIFEQDLAATTLLAVPELYTYGQKMKGFNMKLYTWWMIIAAVQAQVIWWMIYGLYGMVYITDDQGLFAMGNMAFSVCVVYINLKLLVIQYHHKTWVPIFGAALTIGGWVAWELFLAAIYTNSPGPYTVYKGFSQHFGRNPSWWAVHIAILAALIVPDLVFEALKRRFWPSTIQVWQELEQDKEILRKLEENEGDGIMM